MPSSRWLGLDDHSTTGKYRPRPVVSGRTTLALSSYTGGLCGCLRRDTLFLRQRPRDRHDRPGGIREAIQWDSPTSAHTDVRTDVHQGKHCATEVRHVLSEEPGLRRSSDGITRTNSPFRVYLPRVEPRSISRPVNGCQPTLWGGLHEPIRVVEVSPRRLSRLSSNLYRAKARKYSYVVKRRRRVYRTDSTRGINRGDNRRRISGPKIAWSQYYVYPIHTVSGP
jgi:hypothetical protein